MKKIILFFCYSIFLVSCQKEISIDIGSNNSGNTGGGSTGGGTSTNYIKCKVDGVDRAFNYLASASKINAAGTIAVNIHGNVSATNSESISLSENGSNDIAVGTYSENNPSLTYVAGAVYTTASFAVWGAGLNASPAHPFSFTVTNVTSTRITGIFSGGMYDGNGFGTNEKIFSNGEFSVPIQ